MNGVDYRNLKQYLDNPETVVMNPVDFCPHSYPDWYENVSGERVRRSYIERTDDGWLFRDLMWLGHDVEWRAGLLDDGAHYRQDYWNGDYRLTDEGREGWLLPSTELFFEIMHRVMLLDKDPQHHSKTRPFLEDFRESFGSWPLLADHIQYGDGLSARVTNHYGKDVTVDVPVYEGNFCVLAEGQDEGLLGSQVLDEEFSWLEAFVGSKWPLLPQVMQFVASTVEDDFQYSGQGEEFEPTTRVHYLGEARLWTLDKYWRKKGQGRVVSVTDYVDRIDLSFNDRDGDWPAFGVREARE